MVLQFGLPSKTDLADTAGILPGLHSCLEHVLQGMCVPNWSVLLLLAHTRAVQLLYNCTTLGR
jgi:hypothetical protein